MPVDNYPEGSHNDPNAPWHDEPAEGPMWCEACGDETEHIRSPLGEWVCICADLHTHDE